MTDLKTAQLLLCDLVSIPSPSGGEGRIVDWLETWAADRGITSRRVPAENGRDSLVLGASRSPVLAICAHVDTITPTWPDATTPVVDGDLVRGLGSVDDKGGVVACLLAAAALKDSGVDLDAIPAVFAFSVDEETGGSGSRSLAIDLQPRFAIALEGTELNPGIAECGDLEAIITVHGKSAHGSMGELGDNAVHRAANLITHLDELGLDSFTHPLLGSSRASVNEISTGAGMNVVPDACHLRLDIKLVPGQDLAATIRQVDEFAAGFNATVAMVEGTEPFELPPDSPLLASLEEARTAETGEEPEHLGVPAWTDAHNFVDFGGSEALVFGPGAFDTAHTPEEFIDATQIVSCARIFRSLVKPEMIERMAAAPPRTDRPRFLRTTPTTT